LKAEAERWAKECPQQNKGPAESAALAKVSEGMSVAPTKALETKRVESEVP